MPTPVRSHGHAGDFSQDVVRHSLQTFRGRRAPVHPARVKALLQHDEQAGPLLDPPVTMSRSGLKEEAGGGAAGGENINSLRETLNNDGGNGGRMLRTLDRHRPGGHLSSARSRVSLPET